MQDRRLRLIHSGRLLTDDTSVYSWLASLEERQRRAQPDTTEAQPDVSVSTTWLHCSVGPKMEPGEEDETKVQVCVPDNSIRAMLRCLDLRNMQKAQLKPLRGFDRLAAAGFTEQDIANIRSQFHAHSSGDYLDQEFTNEEDCKHQRKIFCLSLTHLLSR